MGAMRAARVRDVIASILPSCFLCNRFGYALFVRVFSFVEDLIDVQESRGTSRFVRIALWLDRTGGLGKGEEEVCLA